RHVDGCGDERGGGGERRRGTYALRLQRREEVDARWLAAADVEPLRRGERDAIDHGARRDRRAEWTEGAVERGEHTVRRDGEAERVGVREGGIAHSADLLAAGIEGEDGELRRALRDEDRLGSRQNDRADAPRRRLRVDRCDRRRIGVATRRRRRATVVATARRGEDEESREDCERGTHVPIRK